MQVLSLTGLIAAGIGLYIALIFLAFYFIDRIIRGKYSQTYLLIFFFLLGATIGVLGQNMVYITAHGPPAIPRFWEQIQHLGLFIIFPVWIHFIFRYVFERRLNAYVISVYAISLFCIFASFTTDWFFVHEPRKFKDFVSFTFGPLYGPLLIFLFINILGTYILMLNDLVRSQGKDRRFKFVFVISSGLTIITGLKDLLETWVQTPLPQLFSYGILLAAFTYLFAIIFSLRDMVRDFLNKRDIEKEFRFAQQAQSFFIPAKIDMKTEVLEAAGLNIPGRFLGGDLYHLGLMPDGRYLMLMGDISGKGLPASLYLQYLLSFFLALEGISDGTHLEKIMDKANKLLYQKSKSAMYATLFSAVLDPGTRTLTYINAGHICPKLFRNGSVIFLNSPGMPLGIEPDARIRYETVALASHDLLLFITDGFLENYGLDEDGKEIEDFIAHRPRSDCSQTVAELMKLSRANRKIPYSEDDMTCLLIRVV